MLSMDVTQEYCTGYLVSLHDSHGSIFIMKRNEAGKKFGIGSYKPEIAITIKVKFEDEDRSKLVLHYLSMLGVKARLGHPKRCKKSGSDYVSIAVRIGKKSDMLTIIDKIYPYSIDKRRMDILRKFLLSKDCETREQCYLDLKKHNTLRHLMR
jgi:hypothetical protein